MDTASVLLLFGSDDDAARYGWGRGPERVELRWRGGASRWEVTGSLEARVRTMWRGGGGSKGRSLAVRGK